MKSLLLIGCFATAMVAQPVNLEGPWKRQAGDDPQWSQPEFDDSAWPVVTMPLRTFDTGVFWLRRTVDAPACGGECYITVGLISEIYEVYVNGLRVGGAGEFASSEVHHPQPRAFRIPAEALHRGSRVTVALRVRGSHMMWGRTGQGISEKDAYWLSSADYATTAVDAARNRIRLQISPSLANLCVQVGIALCLLLLWWGERRRLELLFFAGYLLGQSAVDGIGIYVVSAGGSSLWAYLGYRPCNLASSLLLVAALRIIFGVPSFQLWAIAGTALASLVLDLAFPHSIVFITPWCAALVWLCARAMRVSLGDNVLIVVPCVGYVAAVLNNVLPAPHLFPLAFAVGGLTLSFTSFFQSLLGASMLILVLRRLSDDRREKLRLDSELEAARGIQQLLLSGKPSPSPDYSVDAVYLPAQQVGGDLYYVLPDDDGGFVLIIGDVSGKGLRAALQVSLIIGALRQSRERRQPGRLLAALNTVLTGQTGGGFVTCCCAYFNPHGEVALANAGHLAPYLDGAEAAVESGLPLAVDPHASWCDSVAVLPAGSSITFLSDGVVEAANGRGELFGFDRSREISRQPAHDIAQAARAWGQNDDITVVTVRRSA